MTDNLEDKCLLTDEEFKEISVNYAVEIVTSKPIMEFNQTELATRLIKAQHDKTRKQVAEDIKKKLEDKYKESNRDNKQMGYMTYRLIPENDWQKFWKEWGVE